MIAMCKGKDSAQSDKSLRNKAEKYLQEQGLLHDTPLILEDTVRLLHELQVHHIELGMQNDELLQMRIKAEAALDKYTDLYDFAPAGYLTLDRNNTITNVNFLAASLMGNERSKLIGRQFGVFLVEESRSVFSKFVDQAFDGIANTNCEVLLHNESGSTRTVRISAVTSSTGQDCRMIMVDITNYKQEEEQLRGDKKKLENVVTARTADLKEVNLRLQKDIAERTQMEEDLKKSEERYRHLLSSITSYVYSVHLSGGLAFHTEHGEGCEAVSGYTQEDYANDSSLWIAMIPDEDRPMVEDAITRIVSSHKPITLEHRIIDKSGMLHWIHNTLVPHPDASGVINSYDGIITDITERKLLQQKQARLEMEALQGEKLRALGELASVVAHEVRNPLNAIVIAVELISKHIQDNPECIKYVDRIQRQINRLDNLMKDLLELRRPEEARNRQCCTLVSICRMAADSWMQSNKPLHRLTTAFSPEADKIMVFVDPERVVQVMINLLDNAAQHSPQGTRIKISACALVDGMASIRVSDLGEGLSESALLHAFDPTFTTRKGGSGLGLSIVKHIIESYLGKMTCWNNTPPPGCTVEILLPIAVETNL